MSFPLLEDVLETESEFLLNNVRLVFIHSRRYNFRKAFNSADILHYFELIIVYIYLGVYFDNKLLICSNMLSQIYFSEATLAYFFLQQIYTFNAIVTPLLSFFLYEVGLYKVWLRTTNTWTNVRAAVFASYFLLALFILNLLFLFWVFWFLLSSGYNLILL